MQRVHQHPVLFGSFLAVVLAALTATAPRPAQAGGGKIYVSEAEYGSYASDKEMNAAIKKQSKTSFKGDGTWPLNLMIFLNAPAGADKINVVYYDVTKKREQIDFAEVGVKPDQKIVQLNGVNLSKERGFVKGHRYDIVATRIIGGKEKVYAKTNITLK